MKKFIGFFIALLFVATATGFNVTVVDQSRNSFDVFDVDAVEVIDIVNVSDTVLKVFIPDIVFGMNIVETFVIDESKFTLVDSNLYNYHNSYIPISSENYYKPPLFESGLNVTAANTVSLITPARDKL